jgi:hypothetical protein
MNVSYNPDFSPTGIEGGVDTNAIPWLGLPACDGMAIKPLRASPESGMFSVVVKVRKGATLNNLVYLGAMDMMLLSGRMRYPQGPLEATLEPGIWGFAPANSRIDALVAEEDTEFLANFYGPLAFLDRDGRQVRSLLTALDVAQMASQAGVTLVPNTLAACMADRGPAFAGHAEPLAIGADAGGRLVDEALATEFEHPHFVDTRKLPWIINPGLPDIALKILRVSEETGVVSLIVRHNGVAGPHYHLGAADFLVLNGRIGYRAGPPDGYGPGVWFYEPSGARHEATQRIGEDDLIYTANVYGPVQFDEGPGTPITAVQSWMQYKELADASGAGLVRNTYANDASLLAWSPLGTST